MIIAVPLDENKLDICPSFGRAPYFLIRNTESGQTDILENPAAQAEGGAGLQAAQFVADQNAQALITFRCGENAAEVLKAADVVIYKAEGSDAETNLAAQKEGKLAELTHFHAGFHGIR
ncbi:MAG: NifB/NifX family molybdenum-iron cluster-binding protein [Eubacteriales bacterium]|nr:NifB/NifX family molybdenum-iron cluster-binding protein [Eubacteriales bacterium]